MSDRGQLAWAAAFLFIAALTSDTARAASTNWTLLGTTENGSVKIYAATRNGSWCNKGPAIKLVGEDVATFAAEQMTRLANEIGDHLATECQEMQAFRIVGQTLSKTGDENTVFVGAARGPDWRLAVRKSPDASPDTGTAGSPPRRAPGFPEGLLAGIDRSRTTSPNNPRSAQGKSPGSTARPSAQEEYDALFSGAPIEPSTVTSIQQMVSGNTLYSHDLSGILMSAAYYRPDGQMFFMYLPKSNLLKIGWTLNKDILCHNYSISSEQRCFKVRRNEEGKFFLYRDNQPAERIIRAVEGDPKDLEATYSANPDFYEAEALKNSKDAGKARAFLKGAALKEQMESKEREQLCRNNPTEYRRRYCRNIPVENCAC